MTARKGRIPSLLEVLEEDPRIPAVAGALKQGTPRFLGGLWGSSAAMVAGLLTRAVRRHAVVVTATAEEAGDVLEDLTTFGLEGEDPLWLPPLSTVQRSHPGFDAQAFSARQVVLRELYMNPNPRLTVAPVKALFHPMVSRERFEASMVRIRPGEVLEAEALLRRLVDREFLRVPRVEGPGEVSLRGDVLDIFPWGARNPFRVELFDEVVEEIREFVPATQRSIAPLIMARFPAVRTADFKVEGAAAARAFLDFLPPGALLFLKEVEQLTDRVAGVRGSETALFGGDTDAVRVRLAAMPLPAGAGIINFRTASVEVPGASLTWPSSLSIRETLAGVERLLERNQSVHVFSPTAAERKRFQEILKERLPGGVDRIRVETGRLARGFQLRDSGVAALSHHEFLVRARPRVRVPQRAREVQTRPIRDFLELKQGDYVVHATHGIGRFRGLELLEREGVAEEFMVVEYRSEALLYVPVSKIELVHKYVGGGGEGGPALHRLGGARWRKTRDQVELAVLDLASELLDLQAVRERASGCVFDPDEELQTEFEEAFPYEETPDQIQATRDLKADMEGPRPMDRLVCGDVGFGKTEVAMRAVFKAVVGGKQVGVLVPTTVLAQQHFQTFSERMRDYPVRVEVLSRFLTPGRQRAVIEDTAAGKVDVLIGTHRIASEDVAFKDLGLVIIDEEQRFGVRHKKFFKRLRATVDLLTLTATPIPRTLHMSLVKLKDISSLRTPPEGRLGITTEVVAQDPGFFSRVMRRELEREGQVYFVHNRVKTIQGMARKVREWVPEARVAVVHGQMPAHRIEKRMVDFVLGKVDILVCTTLIESGLDIPSANTIIIHEADRLGLAELHQLRGRVGRHKAQAYAFLIPTPGTSLTEEARNRLRAIEEFSDLGAGFQVAMKDLEIRGAGNLLGAQQHGHIAAVGYEMYCRLLRSAVKRFKNEPEPPLPDVDLDLKVPAYLSPDAIPDPRQKMEVLRILGSVQTRADRDEALAEIRDRFGPPQPEVQALADLSRIQHGAAGLGIEALSRSNEVSAVLLRFRTDALLTRFLDQSGGRAKFLEDRVLLAHYPGPPASPEAFLDFVLDLLAHAGAKV